MKHRNTTVHLASLCAPRRSTGPPIKSGNVTADLTALLSSGDLCSKRWIWEQYDYQVRTNTLAGPGAEAAVVRIKGTPTSVAMALDGNGRYCALDPREGTKLIVAECCRNLSTVGALPIATTNNLNFGNPERPEIMAQIVESIEGLAEACQFFEVPVTGGNVSLYNETLGSPIFPTPVVGIVGTLPTDLPIPLRFPREGLTVVLLGGFGAPEIGEMGGTQYAKVIQDSLWGIPPKLDMAYEKRVQATVRELVRAKAVSSAHDIGEGGFAVALAECSFGEANIAADIRLDSTLAPEIGGHQTRDIDQHGSWDRLAGERAMRSDMRTSRSSENDAHMVRGAVVYQGHKKSTFPRQHFVASSLIARTPPQTPRGFSTAISYRAVR